MKDPRNQRIKELEKKLKEAELKAALYEKMIDLAEQESGVEIKKKYGAEQSAASEKNIK